MDLDPTLLLDPAHPFGVIQTTLFELGWEEAPPPDATPPGAEPEVARFHWPGGRPLLGYRYHPAVHLRVLEAGEATPTQRAAIHTLLGMKEEPAELLKATDPTTVLRGIAALDAVEAIALRPLLQPLEAQPELREAALEVGARLDQKRHTRALVVAGLEQMATGARALLADLGRGADPTVLRPEEEDYDLVFAPELHDILKAGYAPLWAQPPSLHTRYPALSVQAALAGLLRAPGPIAWKFPGGYRAIAGFLEPSRTWLCWQYHPVGGSGMNYDGLVWQGERWVWFPKAWRILEPFFVERGLI